jgi:Ca-activated chloride channel family protein
VANIIFLLRIYTIANRTRSTIHLRIYIKFAIRTIVLACMIIALLGPSFGKYKSNVVVQSKNILFLLDVSLSMDARDVSPSRIEKAHTIINNIVNQNPTDQFGLIAYSTGAAIVCPVTSDHETFLVFEKTATTSMFDNTGTNTYDAIRMSNDYVHTYNKNGNTKPTVIVLLTDGEGIDLDVPITATDEFSSFNIVGIGTEKGARIPYLKSYKRDKNGEEVISSLHRDNLFYITGTTNASYYEVSSIQNNETTLYSVIRNFKGENSGLTKIDVAGNKYYYFLYVALILVIFDVLITVKTVKI